MTGTGLSQVLGIVLSVFVARIFDRDDFATLEQFAMYLVIASVITTGKFELAVMKPREEGKAIDVIKVAFWLSVVTCLIAQIIVAFGSEAIAERNQNPELATWLWFLPLALFFFSQFNIFNYWFSRNKSYKKVAASKVIFSLVSEPLKIVFGLLGWLSGGLVMAVTAGRLTSGGYMLGSFVKEKGWAALKYELMPMKEAWKEYRKYPLYVVPGSFLSRIAQWAHIALFSHFFGLYSIAFFALSRRVFLTPLSILSVSYSQVFYQRISDIESIAEVRKLYLRSLRNLSAVGVGLLIMVYLLPANSLGVLFGDKWIETLDYLRILSFWFVMNFVAGSLGFVWHRLELQRTMLALDTFHFLLVIGSLVGAFYAGLNEMESVVVFVIAKCVYFAINLITAYFALSKAESRQVE
ncbi:MAG: oligosaccharide flippase family protein [Flavobacteriales bacterium]|nr:oligosaccharide flippase family protein [Flavobacteriales bacterium]